MDCAGRQCNSGDRKMLRKKKNSGERKVEKRKERKQQNYYIYNGNTWGLGGRQWESVYGSDKLAS